MNAFNGRLKATLITILQQDSVLRHLITISQILSVTKVNKQLLNDSSVLVGSTKYKLFIAKRFREEQSSSFHNNSMRVS